MSLVVPITNAVDNNKNTCTYPGCNDKYKYRRKLICQNNTHPNPTKKDVILEVLIILNYHNA